MTRFLRASCALVSLLLVRPVVAQEAPAAKSRQESPTESRLLGGAELRAESIHQTGPHDLVLEGAVTIASKEVRMQADRIEIREERYITAEGNVLIVWGGNRLSGTRMTYDLKEERGAVENAMGQVDPEFYFTADRAEKVGPEYVFLDRAIVTTCTQPVPYWSFTVSSAKIHVDHYAHMRNLRLRALRVPVFYLPYLIWPVKSDRAAGLLLPTFGSTRHRGTVFTEALFLPFGKSADLTAFAEYYTLAGWGGGGEFEVLPNRDGAAHFSGFYIQDQVAGFDRYRITYKQTQSFLNGFRMIADVNQVSDFNYFTDFERELRLASSPSILARVEFTRNGEKTSINVREERREQLFFDGSSLVQQTLPLIEWRARSQQLGKTPLYFSYQSSLASIQQRGFSIDADYLRGDIYPTLSAPLSPQPWLDVTPNVSYRLTRYTERKDPASGAIVEQDLMRGVAAGTIEVVGPKFSRIFERPENSFSPRFKNVIEPRIVYSYGQRYDRFDEVISYDQVDLTSPSNLVTYGLRTRLYAQRPRAEQAPPKGEGERILLPGQTAATTDSGAATPPATQGLATTGATPEPEAPPPPREPIEIASFEMTQSRSFDTTLSTADLDSDGLTETTSRNSDVSVVGRFNPLRNVSLDLRSLYNPLYHRWSTVSFSGNLVSPTARLGFSLVRTAGLSGVTDSTTGLFTPTLDTTQLRLGSGLVLFGGKLRLDVDGTYTPTARGLEKKVPDQLWRMQYYTQCCGFLAEYLKRDFAGNERAEFRFSLDLRGIGKLLDLREGESR